MSRRCGSYGLLLAVLTALADPVWSDASQLPDVVAVPTFEKHAELIRNGISLHDNGDYNGAIGAYRTVLDDNPDDVSALYELAFSYFVNQDYANCIRSATKGTAYHSMLQTQFQGVLGNCLDASGEPEKALRVYHLGLEESPMDHLLHYNVAITYQNLGKSDEAILHFKKAINSNPHHAGSHLALSEYYLAHGYRIPALLASARFLILEPDSARVEIAMSTLHSILRAQTIQVDDKRIRIFMNSDAKTDEGNFRPAELALSLAEAEASALSEEGKDQSPLKATLHRFGKLFGFLGRFGEMAKGQQQNGFAWDHYVSYFGQVEEMGFIEPFVYYTHQTVAWEGIEDWIDANDGRIEDFLEWSRNYQDWPWTPNPEQ